MIIFSGFNVKGGKKFDFHQEKDMNWFEYPNILGNNFVPIINEIMDQSFG